MAAKRRKREEALRNSDLVATYEAFKLAQLREADDTGALAEKEAGAEAPLDEELSNLIRDAKLGSGSLRLARPATAEVGRRRRRRPRRQRRQHRQRVAADFFLCDSASGLAQVSNSNAIRLDIQRRIALFHLKVLMHQEFQSPMHFDI